VKEYSPYPRTLSPGSGLQVQEHHPDDFAFVVDGNLLALANGTVDILRLDSSPSKSEPRL
jgi:hypothetical protein